MSGCKSCSGCKPEPSFRRVDKLDKLEKDPCSGNPRYPRIVTGCQAILTDESRQLIVEVLSDDCDERTDRFTVRIERALQGAEGDQPAASTIEIDQAAGDCLWKLQALI